MPRAFSHIILPIVVLRRWESGGFLVCWVSELFYQMPMQRKAMVELSSFRGERG